jgi:NAD(P)H dehydrogenase (quinone)
LAELINTVYGTDIKFNPVSVEAYEKDRKPELGDFMGTIIAGIYEGIGLGADDVSSDYEKRLGGHTLLVWK